MLNLPLNKERKVATEDAIFISWASENGRTVDLAKSLGVPAYFLAVSGRRRLLRRYGRQAFATVKVLRSSRPKQVLLMLPPTPLLVVCALWARGRSDRNLIGDLHTGFFSDPKWSRFTAFGLRLLRPHAAIVTNRHLQGLAETAGVRSVVAHDPLTDRTSTESPDANTVLCPVSYANDEPIDTILAAAKLTPEITWRLTGRAPDDVVTSAPNNVAFTGFVSDAELVKLFRDSAIVVALTTRDHTMQRAGYEALMSGRPQVTSHFKVLTEFVGAAGRTIDPSRADMLAVAVRSIMRDLESWEASTFETLRLRLMEQSSAQDEIRHLIFQQDRRNGGDLGRMSTQ